MSDFDNSDSDQLTYAEMVRRRRAENQDLLARLNIPKLGNTAFPNAVRSHGPSKMV